MYNIRLETASRHIKKLEKMGLIKCEYEKESIKIKKDTFDSINKVIEESKKISEMKPKLDSAYKAMK